MPLKVITRLDCLRGKEKKEYLMGGHINMYSIFDTIEKVPSYEEINKMDVPTGNKLLLSLRGKFKVKELTAHWHISDYTMYHSLYPKFGIETNYSFGNKRVAGKRVKNSEHILNLPEKNVSKPDDDGMQFQFYQMAQAAVMVKAGVEEIVGKLKNDDVQGFNIRLKGSFDGKPLQNRLLKIIEMLEESAGYEVTFTIRELPEEMGG